MTSTRIKRFLGDGEYEFNLSGTQIVRLEKLLNIGIGELSQRVVSGRFHHVELIETVRHGLIGAGTSHEQAANLIAVYVDGVSLRSVHTLAVEILAAAWDGTPEPDEDTTKTNTQE
ncbi:gene transfer agent family protein [Xanthobacter autotrophicus]|uniref:gene transfer agent family protein n=1 Tax=Xanthobacter TaxID=279 RepID=UPI0024AC42B3|nr:gene transfer agent family protein [Xanthobacter autotrophicus]MDI4664337.1 gene transfer agent family protein [Xanthobacter autotrophicus]